MSDTREDILQFFIRNYSRGAIALVGTNDTIGLAIREAQSSITRNGSPSLWSHAFLLGDLRFDMRGPGNSIGRSPYIFESDLHVDIFKPEVLNGAQENWVGKWCVKKVENAAVIDLGLSEDKENSVLGNALQLVDEQMSYPLQELFGTWLAIITKKQWLPNPIDDPHAMYCSAFVRYCYRQAGVDFLDEKIAVKNTTPEDVAQGGEKASRIILFNG